MKDKGFDFAVEIVETYKNLVYQQKEYVMSKQLLRSGTAIGALVSESEHAESKADFIHKLAIAQKEANETIYWLELLHRTDYLDRIRFDKCQISAIEVIKLLTSIIRSAKSNK